MNLYKDTGRTMLSTFTTVPLIFTTIFEVDKVDNVICSPQHAVQTIQGGAKD